MPAKTAFTEPQWKIPGYSGCIPGLSDTFKQTPVAAQVELNKPEEGTFAYSRIHAPIKHDASRDPCNYRETFHKSDTEALWPRLQAKGAQDSARPPASNIPMGDDRINPFATSYRFDFNAPFAAAAKIRSPMRNKDLAAAGDEANLKSFFQSAYNRVGEARIKAMLECMRERLEAKLGNINNNGFRTRRLFKMYDTGNTGLIHFEDFRMMGESFGMQLDDDSLLALYHVMDPQATGYLAYEEVVKQLLDEDYFNMYTDKVDNTMATTQRNAYDKMISQLNSKLASNIRDILRVFQSFDVTSSGFVVQKDFLAGCAALGVVYTGHEKDYIMSLCKTDDSGRVEYSSFCSLFM